MTDSLKENFSSLRSTPNTTTSLQCKELKLSLIKELKAILKHNKNCAGEPLEIKHTFPIGFGMFES